MHVYEMVVEIARRGPDILNVMNRCLNEITLLLHWKCGKLVLLLKGLDKPVTEPSSFRPICMLDACRKVLERLILKWLDEFLDNIPGNRAEHQYGFRKGRSMIDVIFRVMDIADQAATGNTQDGDLCVLVLIDVKNAFKSAP